MANLSYNRLSSVEFSMQIQDGKIESVGFIVVLKKEVEKSWTTYSIEFCKELESSYGAPYLDGVIIFLDKPTALRYHKTVSEKTKKKLYVHAVLFRNLLTVGHIPTSEYINTLSGVTDYNCDKCVIAKEIKGIRRIQ